MSPETEWQCWKIIGCVNENCPARNQSNRTCWEIASELDDYRTAMNICRDCLVYLAKNKNSILSETEISEILTRKGVCALAEKCLDKSE